MLPTFVLYLVLVAGFNVLTAVMGLGQAAFMTEPQMGQMPSVQITSISYVAGILQVLFFLASGIFGYGIVLSIYRIVRYESEVDVADSFYLFNGHFGKTLLVLILESVIMGIAFLLLIIPGIIFSLAMIPLGAVIGIEQLNGRMGVMEPIKKTWQLTKGHKGMIFGRMMIVVILTVVISMIGMFATISLGSGAVATNLFQAIITIVGGLIAYAAITDIIRELVERGAFDAIDERDDWMEEGEVL